MGILRPPRAKCLASIEDSNDALMVAQKLGIPYQVIDMSELYKEKIVDYMFEEPNDKFIAIATGSKCTAVKCDLCEGRAEGPACVEACPNKALTYITPGKMEDASLDGKSRKAVLEIVSLVKSGDSSKKTDSGKEV